MEAPVSSPAVIIHMETSPYTADEIPSEQETLTYTSVYADEAVSYTHLFVPAGSSLDSSGLWTKRDR